MKKKEIEKIFNKIEERFEFEFRNASDIEDLKERIEKAVSEIQDELLNEEE